MPRNSVCISTTYAFRYTHTHFYVITKCQYYAHAVSSLSICLCACLSLNMSFNSGFTMLAAYRAMWLRTWITCVTLKRISHLASVVTNAVITGTTDLPTLNWWESWWVFFFTVQLSALKIVAVFKVIKHLQYHLDSMKWVLTQTSLAVFHKVLQIVYVNTLCILEYEVILPNCSFRSKWCS